MQAQSATFRTNEAADTLQRAYLYIFRHIPRVGEVQLYHVTSFDRPISVTGLPVNLGTDPQVFISGQIQHSAPEQQSENSEPKIDVTVALSATAETEELKKYFIGPLPKRLECLVARINSPALATEPVSIAWGTDSYTIFRGRMASISFRGAAMGMSFVNLMLQDDGRVPRFFYQKLCQHQFGGIFCRKDLSDPKITKDTTIVTLNRANRTVEIADTDLDGVAVSPTTFQGGLLYELDGGGNVVNTISISSNIVLPAAAGVRLRLSWWSGTLEEGNSIRVVRGCIKTVPACVEYLNIENFGGHPWIPISNPAIDSIAT